MRRRDFLAGGLATAAHAASKPSFAASQMNVSDLTRRVIDAHCHIFNANDLPIVGFLEKDVLPNRPQIKKQIADYDHSVNFFLSFLSDWLQDKASAADVEHALLVKILNGSATKPSREQIEDREIQLLTDLIDDLENMRVPVRNTPFREAWLASLAPGILVGLMHREAFPAIYTVKGYDLNALNDNSDNAFSRQNWQPTKFLAETLYNSGNGPITFYTKWALQCTRYRFELADELYLIHRKHAILVTPAMVDFSKWLDVDDPTPIADQIEVMSLISRQRQPSDGVHVHGFVAFDPLRQAIHEKLGEPAEQSPFALVQRAIEGEKKIVDGRDVIEMKGFIGVKLYPPMGFRATNNASAGDDFPCSVRFGSGSPGFDVHCPGRTNHSDALGNEPGKLFDNALMKLYAWCDSEAVPILAHTHKSNGVYGPAAGYATRASPKYWMTALQSFPHLRVNMAHFGNFDNAFDDNGKVHLDWMDKTWEGLIGNIWKGAPDSHVYADISYFSDILDIDACKEDAACRRAQIKSLMIQFRKQYPMSADRLIYGTDWIMVGLEAKFPSLNRRKLYPEIVADFLYSDVGYSDKEIENIMFNNAVRFLGLGRSDRTRARLEKFYSDAQIDSSWMNTFDS